MFDCSLSEITTLLRIFFTAPVTSATAERSISALRRTAFKKFVMAIHSHKEWSDSINLKTIAKKFVERQEKRRRYFGYHE